MDAQEKTEEMVECELIKTPGKWELMNALFQDYLPTKGPGGWKMFDVNFTIKYRGQKLTLTGACNQVRRVGVPEADHYWVNVIITHLSYPGVLRKVSTPESFVFKFSTSKRTGRVSLPKMMVEEDRSYFDDYL